MLLNPPLSNHRFMFTYSLWNCCRHYQKRAVLRKPLLLTLSLDWLAGGESDLEDMHIHINSALSSYTFLLHSTQKKKQTNAWWLERPRL